MPTYRVFVSRHYIAVDCYDIEAKTLAKAETAAKQTANKLKKDARAKATDNGWQCSDKGVPIPCIGSSSVPFTPTLVNTTTNGSKVYKKVTRV